nr:serine/threonine-protein kinase prpf4B [Ipomoea batatas]
MIRNNDTINPDFFVMQHLRIKHGHHHHHRRRHHRHHGKKPEEIDSKLETEVKEAEVEIEGGKEVLGSGAVGVAMSSSNLGIDYDMEEGEIIEDDVPPTSAAYGVAEDIENKKLSSDMVYSVPLIVSF